MIWIKVRLIAGSSWIMLMSSWLSRLWTRPQTWSFPSQRVCATSALRIFAWEVKVRLNRVLRADSPLNVRKMDAHRMSRRKIRFSHLFISLTRDKFSYRSKWGTMTAHSNWHSSISARRKISNLVGREIGRTPKSAVIPRALLPLTSNYNKQFDSIKHHIFSSSFQCDGFQSCPDSSEINSSSHFLFLDEYECEYDSNWYGNLTGTNNSRTEIEEEEDFNLGMVIGISIPLSILLNIFYVSILLCCGGIGLAETKAVLGNNYTERNAADLYCLYLIVSLTVIIVLIAVFAVLSGVLHGFIGASICLALAISVSALALGVFIFWTGVWELHATR